jgi:hypothetical protein
VDEFAHTFNWNYQPEETKSVSAANKREWLLPSAVDDINSFIGKNYTNRIFYKKLLLVNNPL